MPSIPKMTPRLYIPIYFSRPGNFYAIQLHKYAVSKIYIKFMERFNVKRRQWVVFCLFTLRFTWLKWFLIQCSWMSCAVSENFENLQFSRVAAAKLLLSHSLIKNGTNWFCNIFFFSPHPLCCFARCQIRCLHFRRLALICMTAININSF